MTTTTALADLARNFVGISLDDALADRDHMTDWDLDTLDDHLASVHSEIDALDRDALRDLLLLVNDIATQIALTARPHLPHGTLPALLDDAAGRGWLTQTVRRGRVRPFLLQRL